VEELKLKAMLDPIAIFELKDDSNVENADQQKENVSRIAVWDWYERSPDGESSLYELHSNDGDYYVDTDDVDEIIELN
jgi:hypothetical protein